MHRYAFFKPKYTTGPAKQWQGKRFLLTQSVKTYDLSETIRAGRVLVATGILTRSEKGVEVNPLCKTRRGDTVCRRRSIWVRATDLRDPDISQEYLPRAGVQSFLRELQRSTPLVRPR